jgi:hypothetical protein
MREPPSIRHIWPDGAVSHTTVLFWRRDIPATLWIFEEAKVRQ